MNQSNRFRALVHGDAVGNRLIAHREQHRVPRAIGDAGDPSDNPGTPSYAIFGSKNLATTDGVSNRSVNRNGQNINEYLSGAGDISNLAANSVHYSNYQDATGHNIADVFWNWSHTQGSGFRPDDGVDWLYVLGYPISEPYWIDSTIAGTERRVLVQLFERRVLTYTPDNPPAYQVEFGNIGQHYYRWRYGLQANASVQSSYTIAFELREGTERDVATINFNGNGLDNLTENDGGDNVAPLFSPDAQNVAFLRGGNDDGRTLAVMEEDGTNVDTLDSDVQAILDWSYDSILIAYSQGGNVYVINKSGGLERIPIGSGNEYAAFAPNTQDLLVTDGQTVRRFNPLNGDNSIIATAAGGTTITEIAWLRGNRLVAMVYDNDSRCVVSYGFGPNPVELAATCSNDDPISLLRVSADQTEAAYVAETDAKDVIRIQRLTGTGSIRDLEFSVGGTGRLTITGLDWSYHPTDLVVGATRGGDSALFAVAHDKRDEREITDPDDFDASRPSLSGAR
jgi:hypothetical protein